MSFSSSPPPSYQSQPLHVSNDQVDDQKQEETGVESAPPEVSPRQRTREVKLKVSVESLQRIAGNEVRRSTYGPEFLKQVAHNGLSGEVDVKGKFKVVTGPEAASIYEGFVGSSGQHEESSPSRKLERSHSKTVLPHQPVVFAFTASDGARKVVDYYMTWRGKTKTHRLKGSERKPGFLDAEFKRVTKTLDKEFKRWSLMSTSSTIPEENEIPSLDAVPESLTEAQPEQPSTSANETPVTKPVPPPIVPPPPTRAVEPSRLSASSVVSLPMLNMIRGVPLGNRAPLIVTNPDFASSSSGSPRNTIIEDAGDGNSPPNTPHQALQQVQKTPDTSPGDRYKPKKSSPLASRSDSDASSSESPKSGTSPAPKGNKQGDSNEILIVLLDEKSNHTWHGMEKNLERKKTKTSIRASSGNRQSPWFTPLVPAEKITYRRTSMHRSRSNSRQSRSPFGSASSSSPSNSASNSEYDTSSDSDSDYYSEDGTDADEWSLSKRKTWSSEPTMPVVPVFPMKSYLVNEGIIPPDMPGDVSVAGPIGRHIQQLQRAHAQQVQLARNASAASYSPYGSPYISPADIPLPPSVASSAASYSRGPTPQPGLYPTHPSVAMTMGSPMPGIQVAMSAYSPQAMAVPMGYAMSGAPGSPWASPRSRSTPYLPGFVPYANQ